MVIWMPLLPISVAPPLMLLALMVIGLARLPMFAPADPPARLVPAMIKIPTALGKLLMLLLLMLPVVMVPELAPATLRSASTTMPEPTELAVRVELVSVLPVMVMLEMVPL